MRERHAWQTAMLAVSALLVASCGSDGSSSAPSTTASVPSTTRTATTTTATTLPASSSTDARRGPLVVDTDLASDDLIALTYLLSDPTVDLLAVTVSGTGEVTCPRGVEVAGGLLAKFGRPDVPVACGRSTPLAGDRVFPQEWRTGADAAYGLTLPSPGPSTGASDAVALLGSAVAKASEPVTLLALGPLTNVAMAFAAEPTLARDLAGIVIMGGAVDVPGNVQLDGASAPLAAEWNLYIDPAATVAVVASGAHVTLVGLDATSAVPVTSEFVDRLSANDVDDATALVTELLTARAPAYLWDPLAAIAAAHPSMVPTAERTISVVTEGADSGRTIDRSDGAVVSVASPPDAAAVLDHLLRTLAGVAADTPLVTPTTVAPVGEATVSYDGTACTYDGPTSVPVGTLQVTVEPGPVPYVAIVAHIAEGATIDEALAWQAAHPGEQPPMVDVATAIGEAGLPSPAHVELLAGQNGVVCGLEGGAVVPGAVVTAVAGS